MQLLHDGEQDPKLNLTIQLLSFYVDRYDRSGREELIFETSKTAKKSNAVKDGFDVIDSTLLEKCVARWKKDWDRGVEQQQQSA